MIFWVFVEAEHVKGSKVMYGLGRLVGVMGSLGEMRLLCNIHVHVNIYLVAVTI